MDLNKRTMLALGEAPWRLLGLLFITGSGRSPYHALPCFDWLHPAVTIDVFGALEESRRNQNFHECPLETRAHARVPFDWKES
jgi:hypothetical protein